VVELEMEPPEIDVCALSGETPTRNPRSLFWAQAGAIAIEAVVAATVPLGPVRVGASGATVSTVQLRVVAGPVVAAAFFARTAKLCPP